MTVDELIEGAQALIDDCAHISSPENADKLAEVLETLAKAARARGKAIKCRLPGGDGSCRAHAFERHSDRLVELAGEEFDHVF